MYWFVEKWIAENLYSQMGKVAKHVPLAEGLTFE